MSFIDVMNTYFRGEKIEALFFILPVGIALCAIGLVAFKAESGGYAWGIAAPFVLFGLVLAGTGIGVGARTDQQVKQLSADYQKDSASMAAKELPRMEKVNRNFRVTFYSFGAIAVIALLFHYLGGASWGRGLGSALLVIAGVGLLIDGFAERRAEPYTQTLKSIVHNR